jgi:hypothetical protein
MSRRVGLLPYLLAACTMPAAPPFPDDFVLVTPPAPYRTWWNLVEECSALRGNFDGLRWYVAEEVDPRDPTVRASWNGEENHILLDNTAAGDGRVVRHEMLHALLGRAGHPPALFAGRCAHLVACEHGCAPREAIRGVAPGARVLRVSDLAVTMRLEPTAPTTEIDSGWFRVVVTVTNPLDEDVWVPLSRNVSFAMREVLPGTGPHPPHKWHGIRRAVPATEPVWAFRRRESRRTMFDVHWPPGEYAVLIAFGGSERGPFPVRVAP